MEKKEKQIIKIFVKRDQLKRCEEFNPILQLHELMCVYDGDEVIGYKIGDGCTKWSELEYVKNCNLDQFWLYVENEDHEPEVACKIFLNPKIDEDFQKMHGNKN